MPPVSRNRLPKDADGFPIPPRSPGQTYVIANGLGRIVSFDMPLDPLVRFLTPQMGRPVFDSTGLTGKYDFTLTYTLDSVPVANAAQRANESAIVLPIFAALDKQLGLNLEPGKRLIDIFVIDHYEKTPVEN